MVRSRLKVGQPTFSDRLAEALAVRDAIVNRVARHTVALVPEKGLTVGTASSFRRARSIRGDRAARRG